MRDWATAAAGGGPDLVFRATCSEAAADRLVQLLTAGPLEGLVRDGTWPGLRWVDPSTAEKLRERERTGRLSNIHLFHQVVVFPSGLAITRGYGGNDARCCGDETRVLARWAAEDGPDLWEVRQEGYGPDSDRDFASGMGGAELLRYLDGSAAGA